MQRFKNYLKITLSVENQGKMWKSGIVSRGKWNSGKVE